LNKIEITLQDILWSLKKYAIWIILTTILFSVGFWTYSTYFITPRYTARISMCVFANQRTNAGGVTNSELQSDARLANTYCLLLKSTPVMNAVSEHLGGTISAGALMGTVSTTVIEDSQFIYVSITTTNAQLSANIANAIAEVAPDTLSELARGGEMIAVDPASVPGAPSYPDISGNTSVGFALGLVLSCAVVIMIALLDTTIWRDEDLDRAFGIPVLGSVPGMAPSGSNTGKRKK